MAKTAAIIPTYNSAELVCERVTQLQKSSFSKVTVCDDSSEDSTVEQLSHRFNDSVAVIAGKTNLGPGGNRNRILASETINDSDFLFFLDADCSLVYEGDLAELVAASFTQESIGVVGFSIRNKDSSLMKWNYGELMHPVHEAADQRLEELLRAGMITKEQFITGAPVRAASLRLLPEPAVKEVGWIAEGCFAIRTQLFKQLNGFTEHMRYHETHDLNARVHEQNFKTIFNPILVAEHLAHDSRMHRREEDIRSGRLYYYQTHCCMNEAVFAKLFDEI